MFRRCLNTVLLRVFLGEVRKNQVAFRMNLGFGCELAVFAGDLGVALSSVMLSLRFVPRHPVDGFYGQFAITFGSGLWLQYGLCGHVEIEGQIFKPE
jgi:hypothetical protein